VFPFGGVATIAQMKDTLGVKRLTQYSIVGIVLAALADSMGASTSVTFMTACIGGPLLHIAWLVAKKRLG